MIPLADLARQKALWAEIPDAQCKGLCVEACGPIGMTRLEAAILLDTGRLNPELLYPYGSGLMLAAPGLVCPMLSDDGRCTVYAVRPAICRGFGAVDHPLMRCPHGCQPAGGPMDHDRFQPIVKGNDPDNRR